VAFRLGKQLLRENGAHDVVDPQYSNLMRGNIQLHHTGIIR
jgi:hypothetical protein